MRKCACMGCVLVYSDREIMMNYFTNFSVDIRHTFGMMPRPCTCTCGVSPHVKKANLSPLVLKAGYSVGATAFCVVHIRDGQLIVKIEIMSIFLLAIFVSSSFFCSSIIKTCSNR